MAGFFDDVFETPQSGAPPAATKPAAKPGFFDDVFAQPEPVPGGAPAGEEGFWGGVKEFGTGVVRGVISGIPKAVGGTITQLGRETGSQPLIATGTEMSAAAEKRLEDNPQFKESALSQQRREQDVLSIRGGAGSAGENLPLSSGPALAGAGIGAVVGGLPGAVAGYAIGSLAALPLFYGQQAEEAYQSARKYQKSLGKSDADAEAAGMASGRLQGLIEVGTEFGSDLVDFALLKTGGALGVKAASKDAIKKMFGAGNILKKAATTLGISTAGEVGEEMAAQAGEAEVEKRYAGGPGASWRDTSSVIVPTALMTLLPGGFVAAHGALKAKAVERALTNPETDPKLRALAAAQVWSALPEDQPAVAAAWQVYAADQIQQAKPIEIAGDDKYVGHYVEQFDAAKAGVDAMEADRAAMAGQRANMPEPPLEGEIGFANRPWPSAATPLEQANQDWGAPATEAPVVEPWWNGQEPPPPPSPPAPAGSLTAAAEIATGGNTRAMPFVSQEAAQARATAESARTGIPYITQPHPTVPGRFTVMRQEDVEAENRPPANPHQAKIDEATAKVTKIQQHLLDMQGREAEKPNITRAARIDELKKQVADLNKSITNLKKLGEAGRPTERRDTQITRPWPSPTDIDQPWPGDQPGPIAPTSGPVPTISPAGTPAVSSTVDAAAHTAATSPTNALPEPTKGQIEAGTYTKGHPTISGLKVSIENPEGSTRRDIVNNAWERTVTGGHYGYIRGTSTTDKEAVDTFVKPGTPPDYTGPVTVIDQVDQKTGKFDEPKTMIGYASEAEALDAYKSNYPEGWKVGTATTVPWDEFKGWVKQGDHTVEFSKRATIEEKGNATEERQVEQGRVEQHQGTPTGLLEQGQDRVVYARQPGEGAEAGRGDRARQGGTQQQGEVGHAVPENEEQRNAATGSRARGAAATAAAGEGTAVEGRVAATRAEAEPSRNDQTREGGRQPAAAANEAVADVAPNSTPVRIKAIEEETGREVEVTMPAHEALSELDSRIQLMKDLLSCLSA